MKSNIIIRDTKVLSKTKSAVKLITYDMQLEGEMVVTKTTEMYDHGNAVAVLLYNESKKTILLTEQFRLPTYINGNKTGMLLEACAGIIDEGETPEETIKREIKEELGYVIENVEKVYEAYSSPGCLTELLTLYIAAYTEKDKKEPGGGLKEEGEYIKPVELPYSKAIEMIANREFREVKSIILLQYLLLKGLLKK